MGRKPSPDHSIDRINNNMHYSCGHCEECLENGWAANCRWATAKENSNNKRSNHPVTAFGETKTISQWVEDPRCVVTYGNLMQRIHRNISPELSITTKGLGYSGRFDDLENKPLDANGALKMRKLFVEQNLSAEELNRQFNSKQATKILSGKSWNKFTRNDGLQPDIDRILESRKLSHEQKTQIIELSKSGKYLQREIAVIVGTTQASVARITLQNGIRQQAFKPRKKKNEIQPPTNTKIL